MKLVTWNVNSLNAREPFVAHYLDEEQPDVLCIQELKLPDERVPRALFTERGYHVAVHGQPRWNGVLIASKQPVEDVHVGLPEGDEGQSRLIAASTFGIRVVNLYCPQGQSVDSEKFPYKLRFFEALNRWLRAACDPAAPLAVVGDINIAREPTDIWDPAGYAGVPSFHPKEHEAYDQLLAFGLQDAVKPHIQPETYSFWDYRGAAFRFNQGMRIDHVLVTEALAARVKAGGVQRDWRKKKTLGGEKLNASDHAPVFVEIE
ncbi:MAG: exodeoxyribonuclease III [Alphaproteobacteria bacterium]|nr:exodeoxyribonuclease III [Alphaproteobacteria bacterium]